MKRFFRNAVWGVLASAGILVACSKKDLPGASNTVPPNNATGATKTTYGLLDSILLYAQQLYYWNSSLPAYSIFLPRNYDASVGGDDIGKGTKEIFDLTRYAINPSTGKSYEYKVGVNGDTTGMKYSYLESSVSTGSTTSFLSNSSDFLDGKDEGFGFYAGFWDDTTLYIRYVETGSPFYNAGIRRGDRIVSIDGTELTFASDNSIGLTLINNILNAGAGTSATFVVQKRSGSVPVMDTVKLTASNFEYDPVFVDTVLTAGSKKVGYVAFRSFTDWTGLAGAHLNRAFDKFAASNIDELVVDLRFNGGGLVETSMNFANLIVPTAADKKKMFSEYYNNTVTSGKATLLEQQGYAVAGRYWTPEAQTFNFTKLGSVDNLKRVFFLVSDQTASASELLINNLKPYVDVKLVGTEWEANSGAHTYGKPVGFFPIAIGDYDMYIPEFWTKNANGNGDYFEGMPTDYVSTDDARYDFGNVKEAALAQALNYIVNGSFDNMNFMSNARNINSIGVKRRALRQPLRSSFNGMVDHVRKR